MEYSCLPCLKKPSQHFSYFPPQLQKCVIGCVQRNKVHSDTLFRANNLLQNRHLFEKLMVLYSIKPNGLTPISKWIRQLQIFLTCTTWYHWMAASSQVGVNLQISGPSSHRLAFHHQSQSRTCVFKLNKAKSETSIAHLFGVTFH